MAVVPAEATLRNVFARAMPPSERLASGVSAGDATGGPATARLVAAWKSSVARTPNAAMRVMEALGLDDNILARMLSPVDLADDVLLPEWARVVERALGIDPPETYKPEDGVLSPFLAVARDDLRELAGTQGVGLSEGAEEDLLDTLRVRLWRVVSPTLEHEKQLLNATGHLFGAADEAIHVDGSARGWRSRLETYPVLAYLIGTVIEHWRSFAAELLSRISEDEGLLSGELFGGEAIRMLTGVSGDAGDLHNGGRSVAILTFDSGQKVVYKPKDLTVAVAYMKLVQRLNDLGLPLALPTRTVIPRGDYSWEEYVAPEGCTDTREIERFYLRMGATIRLFQLLEARDFWLDNLIAQGEHPQFVDLEMLVQPRIAPPSTLSIAEREAWDALEESAHRTAAVGMPMPIAQGAPSEELGALAGPGPFASPFRFDTKALAEGQELPRLSNEGHVLWEHPEHVPHIDGDFAESADYLDAVITGYRAMQECLVANRDEVLDAVRAFRETPVRYIYRDTWTCLKLVQHSVHPGLLTDAAYRDVFLSRLYAPVVDGVEEGVGMFPVVRSEIEALRALDVPFFRSIPASRDLLAGDGEIVQDYFPEAAYDRLVRRVEGLEQFDLEAGIDALRSSFACGRPLEATHLQVEDAPAKGARSYEDLLRIAAGIAGDILDESFGDGRAWLGLTYHPPVDCGGFDVLRPDVLTGTTGLAMMFADLYRCTGETRWRDAARNAIEPTRSAWQLWMEHPHGAMHHGGSSTGAFYGSGAWLFGTARVAEALGDAELRAIVESRSTAMIERLGIEGIQDFGNVADGPAGLLLSALNVAPNCLDASSLSKRLLESLEGVQSSFRKAYLKPDRALASLPQGPAAAALVLVRLLELLPDTEERASLDALTRWANETLARAPVSTLDGGTVAVIAEIGKAGMPVDTWTEGIEQWLRGHAGTRDPYRLLDVIEVSLQMDDDADARHHGERAVQRLLETRDVTGTWFPGTFAADRHNLSVVWGVPAIAHALTRWACGGQVRSVRLVG